MKRIICGVFLLSFTAFAQTNPLFGRFTLSLTGGVAIKADPAGPIETKRYTVGASAEFAVTDHIAVNFNPLYKRQFFDSGFRLNNPAAILAQIDPNQVPSITLQAFGRTRGNSWEFPIVAKYYFTGRTSALRPFLGTGYSFEKAWFTQETSAVSLDTRTLVQSQILGSSSYSTPTNTGAVFSGGVLINRSRIGFAPEFRYTYWGQSNNRNQNQVDFLLNIRF